MSDEPGFGPETHSTYEPTPEEVAARRSVPAGSSRSPAEEALDRLEQFVGNESDAEDSIWQGHSEAVEALATVRERLERLTEERDGRYSQLQRVQVIANEALADKSAAESEVSRLTAELQHTREGLRRLADGEENDGAAEFARALLAISPSPGETEGASDDDVEACLKKIRATGYYCGREMGHEGPCRPLPSGGGAK